MTAVLWHLQLDDMPQEFSSQALKFVHFLLLRGKESESVHDMPFSVTDYKSGSKIQISLIKFFHP